MIKNVGQFDVIIVGGGAAGIAAAVWCDDLDLTSCIIERSSDLGGQLHWIHNPIGNYPGATFRDGSESARRFKDSILGRRVVVMTDARVIGIDAKATNVELDGGQVISGKAIVFATGVRRRKLLVPGEEEFAGRGILGSGSRDRHEASGSIAAVVGGGDAALENALILADHAEKVFLVHRREGFSARKEFINAVGEQKRIEPVLGAQVKEFGGSEKLKFIDLDRGSAGSQRLAVDKAVVRVGVEPNSDLLKGSVVLDGSGYVVVDRLGRTSVPNIYAIGDVACPESPTIASAVGSAATAIKDLASSIRQSE